MLSMHKSLGEFNLIFAFAPESFALRFFFRLKIATCIQINLSKWKIFTAVRDCVREHRVVFFVFLFFFRREMLANWAAIIEENCRSVNPDTEKWISHAVRSRSSAWAARMMANVVFSERFDAAEANRINIGAWECQDECEENFSLNSINFDSLKGCSENTTAIQFAESSLATIMSLLRMLATSKHILITTRGTVAKTHF